MAKLLAHYKNGNYNVKLFDDGTKIRYNNLDNLTPEFAESNDIEITNCCDGGCEYCYMNCTPQGKHANLHHPIFDTIHSGVEIALNGNDLTHPDLEDFLIRMKDKGVICNLTVNQKHLHKNIEKLKDWQDRKLIWGIGVSLTDSTDKTLIEDMNILKNTVLHVIDGLFTKQDMENLKNNNIKVLILGYKMVGRGIPYYNAHKKEIDANIEYLKKELFPHKKYFNGLAFDNLSIEHLDVQNQVSEESWNLHNMGNEGEYTFFISLPDNTYAISSLESDNIFPIKDIDTFDTMFQHIRKVAGHDK